MTNKQIFHITHVDNLPGIISAGCLWSDTQRISQGFANTNIGYNHIKARRLAHAVTVSEGGTLGNYVPFNFCSRSVMLFVVSKGHENYNQGQTPIVHLVSSTDAIVASGRPWAFTDRHADLGYSLVNMIHWLIWIMWIGVLCLSIIGMRLTKRKSDKQNF